MYRIFILMILGYICNALIQPSIMQMLKDSGQTGKNYQGKTIPNSMGLSLILGTMISIGLMLLFGYALSIENLYTVFAGILMGFAGIIDDFAGDSFSKGFKGHIKNLIRGRLTTGGLKAVTGILASFIIGIQISATYYDLIVNILILSLLTNLLNLMDTRPGRALKFFFILSIIPIGLQVKSDILYIVFGVLLSYFPIDIKARGMLGDTGANFIGMILGIGFIISIQSSILRIILLICVLILNLVSERYSFSAVIENNRILRYVDDIGRKR